MPKPGNSKWTRQGTVTETCVDEVGPKTVDHPLSITRSKNYTWLVTGSSPQQSFSGFPQSVAMPHLTDPGQPSDNNLLAEGLALSNPNHPDMSLPVFLFELGDIPKMIRRWGQVLLHKPSFSGRTNLRAAPRAVASSYVEWQFGIAPFIKDVQKLLEFQALTDKKIRELKNLESHPGGGTRSRTVYTSDISGGVKSSPAISLFNAGSLTYEMITHRRVWVSTRWRSLVPLPDTDAERRALAVRLAYGLDISLATLWEAMPWSWLFDWFGNVGDVLSLTRGTVPVTHSRSCLMRHTFTGAKIHSVTPLATHSLQVAADPRPTELKTREPFGGAVPLIEFGVPLLSGSQLGILGSLAVLKSPR